MIPEDVDRVERNLIDLVSGGQYAPPPYNIMLGMALPFLESWVRHEIEIVARKGIADGKIVGDGLGGW